MGLFDKFRGLAGARAELETIGIDPFGVEIERILSPTEGIIHGRRTVLAGTNNYLGLTFDPDCIAAAKRALDTEGTGTTGSRMANGSYANHRKLERELAAFYGMRRWYEGSIVSGLRTSAMKRASGLMRRIRSIAAGR